MGVLVAAGPPRLQTSACDLWSYTSSIPSLSSPTLPTRTLPTGPEANLARAGGWVSIGDASARSDPAVVRDGPLAAGRRLGRYLLIEPLGAGAQAVVWRGLQTEPVVREVATACGPAPAAEGPGRPPQPGPGPGSGSAPRDGRRTRGRPGGLPGRWTVRSSTTRRDAGPASRQVREAARTVSSRPQGPLDRVPDGRTLPVPSSGRF